MNVGFDPSVMASRMPMTGSAPSQIAKCRANRMEEGDISASALRVTESRADEISARIEDLLKDGPPKNTGHRGKAIKSDIESISLDVPIFV